MEELWVFYRKLAKPLSSCEQANSKAGWPRQGTSRRWCNSHGSDRCPWRQQPQGVTYQRSLQSTELIQISNREELSYWEFKWFVHARTKWGAGRETNTSTGEGEWFLVLPSVSVGADGADPLLSQTLLCSTPAEPSPPWTHPVFTKHTKTKHCKCTNDKNYPPKSWWHAIILTEIEFSNWSDLWTFGIYSPKLTSLSSFPVSGWEFVPSGQPRADKAAIYQPLNKRHHQRVARN